MKSACTTLTLILTKNEQVIAQFSARHWWLTAFKMGCFSKPECLSLRASVTMHNREMTEAFVNGLLNAGYCRNEISICRSTVTFDFDRSPKVRGLLRRIRIRIAQWCNRFWCRIYLFVTRPFCLSVDRILYLYYYLPFAFRKTLRIRRYKKRGGKR